MKRFKQALWLLMLPFFMFTSCKKEDTDGTARLNINMTDAPGDFDAVLIDLQSVEANVDGQWVQVNAQAGIYDLLELTNGKDTLIASADIPAGAMTQIRLVLGSNNAVVVDSVNHPLSTPSAQQSGLKLIVNQTLQGGVNYDLLLDFDAAQSIVVTGNNKYILKPVIKVIAEGVDGAIKGSVNPVVGGVPVYAVAGTDTTGTFTSASGEFLVQGLSAGTYNVIVAPLPPLKIGTVNNVGVNTGQVTTIGVIQIN